MRSLSERNCAVNVVELENVSFTHHHSVVLERISLEIGQGEFLAVLGGNGAGKSTLLKLITGTLRADSGTINVLGKPVARLGAKRVKIGYLPQSGGIDARFPISALQVVVMGLVAGIGPGRPITKMHRLQALQALDTLGVSELAGSHIGQLSVGQRQRVFLARALVNRPELLLLDEPAAGMDTASLENFYELLRDWHRQGTTIVMVSHDIGVVTSFVDRVACLNRRLVAHGKPEAVLGDQVLEEMWGCHTVFFDHGSRPHMVVKKHMG